MTADDLGLAVTPATPASSPIRGGRRAAEAALARVDPIAYGMTRNDLDGAVTRLSPYLRHGVLGLAEVRDAVLARVDQPRQATRLLAELAWRDYWRRAYRAIGDGVWVDREPSKTGLAPEAYTEVLPDDLLAGRTGLACIDAFVDDLHQTGYLHNHARLWLAAYVVHHRRVRWQAGASWFLAHLLDGDPASNNLSWQWVAGTFSGKPYVFNRENLERFSKGAYCRGCPMLGHCDFEGSYERISARLFGRGWSPESVEGRTPIRVEADAPLSAPDPEPSGPAVVWVHADDLNPRGPALSAAPGAPAVFVHDVGAFRDGSIGLKRRAFLAECLEELPAEIRGGDASAEVAAFAQAHGAGRVVTTDSPDPRFVATVSALRLRGLEVDVRAVDPFVRIARPIDLSRFSRYWKLAEPALLGGDN